MGFDCNDFVSRVFEVQNQVRLWHYQTKAFSRHLAFGEFYSSFSDLTDKFIEVYIGKKNDVYLDDEQKYTEIFNLDEVDVDSWHDELESDFQIYKEDLGPMDSELNNILDETLAVINMLKYKLLLEQANYNKKAVRG